MKPVVNRLRDLATRSRPRLDTASLAAVAAVALLATSALAEEQGHGGEEHGGPSLAGLVFAFINFVLFVLIMRRFAWPIVSSALRDRRERLMAALEAARQARAEAEAIKADFEARMRTLEADSARAREEILAVAETEARHVLEAARVSAERIRADARLVADQEVARAKREIQEEAATHVGQLAERIVSAQLTPSDQTRLVNDFLSEVKSSTGPARSSAASHDGSSR